MSQGARTDTAVRPLRQDGRMHFYRSAWRDRLLEWITRILWALMPIVAILAYVWATSRG